MSEFSRIPTNETGFRLQQAVSLDRFVESQPFSQYLRSPEGRSTLVKNIEADTFIALVSIVNSKLVDRPIEESQFTEEVNAIYLPDRRTTLDVAPAPEDKVTLLERVLQTARSFDDPEEQAVVLGFGINAVHPFKSANGRTARAIYLLFSRDYYYGNVDLVDVLGEDGDDTHMLDGNLFTPMLYSLMQFSMGSHHYDQAGRPIKPKYQPACEERRFLDISWLHEGMRTTRREYDAEQTFNMWTILSDANLAPMMAQALIEKTSYRSVRDAHAVTKGGTHTFLVDKFLINASQEEMNEAYGIFRLFKIVYIENFLDELSRSRDGTSHVLLDPRRPQWGALTPLELAKRAAREGNKT